MRLIAIQSHFVYFYPTEKIPKLFYEPPSLREADANAQRLVREGRQAGERKIGNLK